MADSTICASALMLRSVVDKMATQRMPLLAAYHEEACILLRGQPVGLLNRCDPRDVLRLRHPACEAAEVEMTAPPSLRSNETGEPASVRLVVESGPRGCILSVLALGAIVLAFVIVSAALIRFLSQWL